MQAPPPSGACRPLLAVVGGFLGAGKTTTIQSTAEHLRSRGRRVAIITNDQSSELFDTEIARRGGTPVAEIPDGCFCCQYDRLDATLDELVRQHDPDVVLAEAVGSCTDLAATVYQPMRQLGPGAIDLAPLAVVADGLRLRELARGSAAGDLPPDISWLHDRQLAEADLILLSKVDLLAPEEIVAIRRFLRDTCPGVDVLPVSGLTGAGVDAWVARLSPSETAGDRILTIDYDRYADAEAQLGWVNLSGTVHLPNADSGTRWLKALLHRVHGRSTEQGTPIAHLKAWIVTDTGSARGQMTGSAPEPWIVSEGSCSGTGRVIVNGRAAVAPEILRAWIDAGLNHAHASTGGELAISREAVIRPGRPVPVHRLQPVASHGLAPPR